MKGPEWVITKHFEGVVGSRKVLDPEDFLLILKQKGNTFKRLKKYAEIHAFRTKKSTSKCQQYS